MTREELSWKVNEALGRLLERDATFASVPESVASWAYELTDMFRTPIVVMPVMMPKSDGWTYGVVAYAVPIPSLEASGGVR